MLMRRLLDGHARHRAERIALRDGTTALTYRELDERAHRLGAVLLEHASPGDRVAYLSENSFRYFEWYFACCETGLVAATVNSRWQPHEIASYLRTIGPRILIVDIRLASIAVDVLAACDSIELAISFDSEAADGTAADALDARTRVVDYELALASVRPRDRAEASPDAPSIISATSGTAGRYRGAIITQRATWSAGLSCLTRLRLGASSRLLTLLPLHFAGGSPNKLLGFFVGAETIVLRRFSVDSFVAASRTHRPTFTILVPTMLYDLVDALGTSLPEVMESYELIGTGGAPIDGGRFAQVVERLGPRFVSMYGLTEACGTGSALHPEDYWGGDGLHPEQLRTVGRPWPGVDLTVVAEDGSVVPNDGETMGEIVVGGPTVSIGYWGGVDAAETFRDGRVHTGDLAVVEPDGSIRVVDRRKDIIITGGINVPSREVEETLQRHPAVAAAAVVGVPDDRYGEAVCAAVVVTSSDVTSQDLEDWCRRSLAGPKRPKRIVLVDALPMNSTGKVLKQDVRSLIVST